MLLDLDRDESSIGENNVPNILPFAILQSLFGDQ